MLKDKIINIYKQNLFSRCDDNGSIYYFSEKDFINLHKEEYSFSSSKGYKLNGAFYYYDNYQPDRLIIFDHGMGGGHLSYFKEIEMIAKHGYMVLSYDHSGCMKSEGNNTGGFGQSLCDLNDCIISLKENEKYNKMKISVVGHSWGAFSTMNIPYFHNDLESIVAMSGFISIKQVLGTMFKGILKSAYNDILKLEEDSNPNLININAIDSLKDFKGKALIIHSKDDKTVNYKYHFDILKNNVNNENVKFLLLNKKYHNPNYTEDAVKYKDKFFKIYTKYMKKNMLKNVEEKEQFKKSFDWNRMTMQDKFVWDEIFKVLDNE